MSNKNVNKQEKPKHKKNKNIMLYLLMVVIAVYLAYAVYLLVKQPTDTFTIENGTLYLEETNVGYVIRDEIIVKGTNYKNGMEQIKTEGQKTAKGESIYRYYSINEQQLIQKISDLDSKIQETIDGQSEWTVPDMKLIENQIDEKVELLNKMTDISKMTEYKKQIDKLVKKKAKIAGESSPAGSYLKQLYSQRTELEKQLNSGAEYVTAPKSGIVSYRIDGLEETLSPNNFSSLSKEFFDKLNLNTGKMIATNNEFGKIIDNFSCYIATISHSEQAKEAQIADKVKVRLSNNIIIDAKIVHISQENENERLLILEINKQIEELTNYRKISFDLIWWSFSGLKVPNQAILQENNISYIVRNRVGYLDKIPVKVAKQNEKYCIIKNYTTDELKELGFTDFNNLKKVSLYDEILLHPDTVEILQ